MRIKLNSDNYLPLNKTLEIHNMIMVVRDVFHEDNKYYPQVFLDECLYKLQMMYFDRTEVSEDIDANKTNASKGAIFATIGFF